MEYEQPTGVGRMLVDIGRRILILSFAAVGLGRVRFYSFTG